MEHVSIGPDEVDLVGTRFGSDRFIDIESRVEARDHISIPTSAGADKQKRARHGHVPGVESWAIRCGGGSANRPAASSVGKCTCGRRGCRSTPTPVTGTERINRPSLCHSSAVAVSVGFFTLRLITAAAAAAVMQNRCGAAGE